MEIPSLKILESLISGERIPEDKGEDVFLVTYFQALTGDSLVNIIIDEKDLVGQLDAYGLGMLIMGYASGQRDFLESMNEIHNTLVLTSEGENVH